MTTRTTRTLLAVGALGLTLTTLAACGGEEPTTPAESLAPSSVPVSTSPPESPSSSASSEAPAGPSLEVTVKGDRIDPTNKSFTMSSGQVLTLEITADRPGELHVHSRPEQEVAFKKGRSTIEIKLNQAGQVDIEEHESDALIARVLVK